jgi:hypothetical protein
MLAALRHDKDTLLFAAHWAVAHDVWLDPGRCCRC